MAPKNVLDESLSEPSVFDKKELAGCAIDGTEYDWRKFPKMLNYARNGGLHRIFR
jgi:hypothetical protein